ncbi:MAG: hypothetical protein D6717_06785 [Gammaproteobacteria bacterium]|nr:MAG: hypothetical protein D6717_06785 [Gammaproteobacteria bacterium]
MDYGQWKFWFDVAQTLFMFLMGVYAWQANKHRATKAAIDRVEQRVMEVLDSVDGRLDEHRDRLTSVEREIAHVPGSRELGEIHYRVDQVGQGVKGLEGEVKQINNTVQMIQQYLLESGR